MCAINLASWLIRAGSQPQGISSPAKNPGSRAAPSRPARADYYPCEPRIFTTKTLRIEFLRVFVVKTAFPWDATVKEPLAEPPASDSPWGGTGRRVVPLSPVPARVHNGLPSERQVAKVVSAGWMW